MIFTVWRGLIFLLTEWWVQFLPFQSTDCPPPLVMTAGCVCVVYCVGKGNLTGESQHLGTESWQTFNTPCVVHTCTVHQPAETCSDITMEHTQVVRDSEVLMVLLVLIMIMASLQSGGRGWWIAGEGTAKLMCLYLCAWCNSSLFYAKKAMCTCRSLLWGVIGYLVFTGGSKRLESCVQQTN